jgi:hypothetical protein
MAIPIFVLEIGAPGFYVAPYFMSIPDVMEGSAFEVFMRLFGGNDTTITVDNFSGSAGLNYAVDGRSVRVYSDPVMASAGRQSFTIGVTDVTTGRYEQTFSFSVLPSGVYLPPQFTPVNTSWGATNGVPAGPHPANTLMNGAAPFTYSGSGLPSGLSVDPDTGEISGTPGDTAGAYAYAVHVVDAVGLRAYFSGTLILS